LLALAVAGAAFAAVLLLGGGGHGQGGPGGGGSGKTVRLHGVSGYDPQGDSVEHNELAGQATDGDTLTSWTTETYGSEEFGGLNKAGVGLVLAAGRAVQLASLTVKTPTPGFTAEIQAGNSPTGGFSADSSSQTVNGTTTFTLEGHTGTYYLVWITKLPPGGRAEISEVTAKS
jgi:hypothetical protein